MKQLLLVAIIWVWATSLSAQQNGYTGGGFGHFFTGPAYVRNDALHGFLRNPQAMGPRYQPTVLSTIVGAEGFGVQGRLMFGGGGYVLPMFNQRMDSATATGHSRAGYVKAGYQFHQRYANIAYAYGAAGYGGTSIKIMHEHASMETNQLQDIVYKTADAVFEAGVGFKLMFCGEACSAKKFGGFLIGLDSGCILNIPVDTKYDYATIPPPSVKAAVAPYVRVSIGGGSFRR